MILATIFSVFIALILYLLIFFLTRKINKLNVVANKIESGNYRITVENLGNDEIGSLAKAFNKMTESVNDNINQIKKVATDREIFINNLTHEIRTPLTSIIGFSSLLKDKTIKEPNKIAQYSNQIYEEGIYLKNISDKLTELILISKNMKKEKIDLSNSLNTIIYNLNEQFPNVTIDFQKELEVFKKCDEVLLKSLIFNLIKNGIKSYKKDEKKYIAVILTNTNIIIKDFGKGISNEELSNITQPFYTLNQDRNRDISGMGLGLPLCLKIVEAFNWNINIESELEKGTTITINFDRREL